MSGWDTSNAGEALQREEMLSPPGLLLWTAERQGCSLLGLHVAAEGGFLWSNHGN